MSDIVEGLGTAAEGGLFAKAVSGKQGGGPELEKGHFAEGACLVVVQPARTEVDTRSEIRR